MFRALFAEGVRIRIRSIFAKTLKKFKKEATAFAKSVGSMLLLWIVGFSLLMIFFMNEVMSVQAVGFLHDAKKFDLTVDLAIIMFPYLVFMVMNALFASILNSFEQFALPAFVPIFLNVVLIFIEWCLLQLPPMDMNLPLVLLWLVLFRLGVVYEFVKYGIVRFTISKFNRQCKDFFKRSAIVFVKLCN